MVHQELLDKIKRLIGELFGDTSVPPEQTGQSLDEIISECEIQTDALRAEGVEW